MTANSASKPRGWIFYDGDCPLCTGIVDKFGRMLRRRGFELLPLQTPWVMNKLGLKPGAPLDEMKLMTARTIYSGHHAFAQLARRIWWGWPLFAISKLPGMNAILKRGYRWIADHRHLLYTDEVSQRTP